MVSAVAFVHVINEQDAHIVDSLRSRRRFTLHDTSSMAMAERDYYFRRLAAFTAWQK